jgi:hypothetical protein
VWRFILFFRLKSSSGFIIFFYFKSSSGLCTETHIHRDWSWRSCLTNWTICKLYAYDNCTTSAAVSFYRSTVTSRDVLVTLSSPIIYLYRDHLFEAMWDEVDFKLFTLFDLCEELLRQLTCLTSVTLLDRCRTDVVRSFIIFSDTRNHVPLPTSDFGSTWKSLQQVQLGIGDERCHKKHTGHTIIPQGRGWELYMNVVQAYKRERQRVYCFFLIHMISLVHHWMHRGKLSSAIRIFHWVYLISFLCALQEWEIDRSTSLFYFLLFHFLFFT